MTWLRYSYDAAGRLAEVRNDSDAALETYFYGASNQRLKTDYFGGGGAPPTYYAWDGGQVIGDYRGVSVFSRLELGEVLCLYGRAVTGDVG